MTPRPDFDRSRALDFFGYRNTERIGDAIKMQYNIDRLVELPLHIFVTIAGILIFDSKLLTQPLFVFKMHAWFGLIALVTVTEIIAKQ